MSKVVEYIAVGRRKTAVARVRLSRNKKGICVINDKKIDLEQLPEAIKVLLSKPFSTIGEETSNFSIWARANGGGFMGQAQAIALASSRALEKADPEHRIPLKKAGLLTCDSRRKERKKPGRPGARKRFQFSKR